MADIVPSEQKYVIRPCSSIERRLRILYQACWRSLEVLKHVTIIILRESWSSKARHYYYIKVVYWWWLKSYFIPFTTNLSALQKTLVSILVWNIFNFSSYLRHSLFSFRKRHWYQRAKNTDIFLLCVISDKFSKSLLFNISCHW